MLKNTLFDFLIVRKLDNDDLTDDLHQFDKQQQCIATTVRQPSWTNSSGQLGIQLHEGWSP